MNAKQIWQTTLERLHTKIPAQVYATWFQGTGALSLQDGVLVVSVSTTFSKSHLEVRYTELIRSILAEITGSAVDVRFVVAHELPENDEEVANILLPPPPSPLPTQKRGYRLSKGRLGAVRSDMAPEGASFANSVSPLLVRQVAHRSGVTTSGLQGEDSRSGETQSIQPGLFFAGEGVLNPRYTFHSFITGKSNQLAHAASLAVAENPGRVYNPLFLYGGVGLGKTHLMHAIGHIGEAAGLNVLYVTSEKFTNEIINAIRFQKTEEFRAKQIVVTSDRPPKAIPSLQDRLRSRFEWGLLADVQPPEYEHRLAILRSKAESLRFAVPSSVIEYVARPECSSVRELEGALNRVIAYATLHDAALSIELAVQALEHIYGGGSNTVTRPAISRTMLTARVVLDGVCRYYNVELERMQSKQRDREIVWPRQVAMYLMREETDASLLQIGSALGGRDHTTIIHGCEKVRVEITRDEHLRREVAEVLESLRSAL